MVGRGAQNDVGDIAQTKTIRLTTVNDVGAGKL